MANKTVGTLTVWLRMKNDLKSGFDSAKKTVAAGVKKIKNLLSSTFGVLGMGFGAAAVVGYFRNLTGEMDKIGKSAANLGVATSYFQKMDYAAKRTGTNVEQVFQAFSKIKTFAGRAAGGNAEAVRLFHDMGLSIASIRKMSPEEMFDAVAAALQKMDDPLKRDEISAKLFGESFAKLNNFLRDYKGLGDELQARGGVFSERNIRAAEAFLDACENIQRSIAAWAVNSGFVQKLETIAEYMSGKYDDENNLKTVGGEKQYTFGEGVDYALKQAAESGKYTPEQLALIAKYSGYYKSGVSISGVTDEDENNPNGGVAAYKIIDDALRNSGFGQFARSTIDVNGAMTNLRGPNGFTQWGGMMPASAYRALTPAEMAAADAQRAAEKAAKEAAEKAAAEAEAKRIRDEAAAAQKAAADAKEAAAAAAFDKRMEQNRRAIRDKTLRMQGRAAEADYQKQLDSLADQGVELDSVKKWLLRRQIEQQSRLDNGVVERATPAMVQTAMRGSVDAYRIQAAAGGVADKQLAVAVDTQEILKSSRELLQTIAANVAGVPANLGGF